MSFSKESFRDFLLAAWGGVVLVFQVPLTGMILQDPQSLNLGAWDGWSFVLFCLGTFLLIPAAFGLVIGGFSRMSARWAVLVLAMTTGFCLSMQVNFHYLQLHFMEAAWRKIALAAMLILWVAGFWAFRRTVLAMLKVCAVLSVAVLVSFTVQAAPSNRTEPYHPPAAVDSRRNEAGPVFFLTFEKLSAAYLADESGRILADRFPNLARFVSEADYYPKAYAQSTATIYGLRTLYSGRVVTTDRGWTRFPNLRDIVGGQQVFMLLDLLTDYCDPRRHHCIRTVGQENRRGTDIIIGWYKTYLVTILPDPLERPLVLHGWRFNPWSDLWAGEKAGLEPGESVSQKVGKRQFQALREIVRKEGAAPNLYIMHCWISDGHTVTRLGAQDSGAKYQKDLEEGRRDLALFDQGLGLFIDSLKEQGVYDRSLILVTTDTGSDAGINSVRGEPEFPAFPDTARILLAIKRPGQKAGRAFRPHIRHIDVLPTLLSILGRDPSPFRFEGVPVTDPDETVTLAERPVHLIVTPLTAPILHYQLDRPDGPYRRIR